MQAVLTGERETVFLPDEPYPRYFFAGATYSVRDNRSLKLIAAPADLIANIDVLLEAEDFDVLHIHEPFVPGLGWTALRHAELPARRDLPRQPRAHGAVPGSKPMLRRLFDSSTPPSRPRAATRDTAAATFPGAYRVDPAGRRPARCSGPAAPGQPGPLRVLFAGGESRRKGLGVLLRALALS